MLKRILTISLLCVFVFGSNIFSQSHHRQDINPNLIPNEVKPNYPVTEAIWDVQADYDATTVTGAAGKSLLRKSQVKQ